MRLADPWCLFYLPVGGGENVRDVTYDPTLVFRVDSISSFWRVFNNVPEPKDMGIGTLYLFRDGINPKWEDPRNRDGGVVRVKLDATTIGEAWTVLLCRTVGESWSKSVRNVVNGVALKVRERAFILEVWVTENTAELISDISELLHQFLGGAFPLSYTLHSVAQERAAAAALAEKEKKKNKINARHW
uniref:Putative eukaryotic translation initiation factor 4e n=1 Tax=Trypanosoma congolense (strain IL3000) TaxID=1068625 RepID=G0UNF5_TRYCI|nr:putative eukaryotic translation initiation factor 4e [Trypanosoma congolense IL3000]